LLGRVVPGVLLAVGVLGCSAGTAGAVTDAGSLKVDVTTDVRNAKSGDVVTYTLHVHNPSDSPYPHLRVFHRLPAGFKVVSATPHAATGAVGPEWTVDLAPGQSLVLSDTTKAGSVADAEQVSPKARTSASADQGPHTFTTTACALDGSTHETLACGDARQSLADAGADSGAAPVAGHPWQPGLMGIGLIAVAIAVVREQMRKRKGSA
jgi:uncharacterized repeat protein (TIGR01451 family)